MRRFLGLMVALAATPVLAAPTIDGTRDAQYGAPLAVQTVQTQFGDANPNNGSELDAGYGVIDSGKLYLMITGNVEANFNKLSIFLDSKAGGQSVFDSSGNDDSFRMDGLVFDAGFTADYHLIVRRGNASGNDKFDLDFADLGAQTSSSYQDFLAGSGNAGVGTTGTGVNLSPISVGYDNSNTGGVTGGTGAADAMAAAAVTTGLELCIDLADLGYTGGDVRVMVGQNGGGHDFWSNQFLGGLAAPQGNLGGDGFGNFTGESAIDFTLFAGDQFFTISVPEPGSIALVMMTGFGAAAVGMRRRLG